MDNNPGDLTPIQDYYKGAKILITGATGFLGKVLISKLLRTCHDIDTLYFLIRNKKGKKLDQRIDELFSDEVFDKLRTECPEFRKKVIGINGDCVLENLGLSEENTETLTNNVTLIFHCAATVRFDEPIRVAAAINVRATRDLLTLALRMRNLRHVVHVSTAYSHCEHSHIAEEFYVAPMPPEQLLTLTQTVSDRVLDEITPTLLAGFPNTYAFTKACAEEMVHSFQGKLPLVIVRPSVILSTYKEPMPGWINNMYGAAGITVAAMPGILCTMHCDKKVNANIIPVDMVVNAMITAPWDNDKATADRRIEEEQERNEEHAKKRYQDIRIYNYESSNDKPITWGAFHHHAYITGIKVPTIRAIRYFNLHLQKNLLWHRICTIFLHLIPGFLFDLGLRCAGQKPMLLNGYEKIHKFSNVISFFCTNNWTFGNHNVRKMCDGMSELDRRLFMCDVKELDWREYFGTYTLGIRTYLLKDPPSTIDAARKWFFKLYLLSLFITALQYSGALYLLYLFLKAIF